MTREATAPLWVGTENVVQAHDKAVHDWYRFVLSFPPHLVRAYIEDFGLTRKSTLLDPFCGTGTAVVEAKLNAIRSIGLEAAPMAHFASSVKTSWGIDSKALIAHAESVARAIPASRGKLRTLAPEQMRLLLRDSISPKPLHRVLILLETMKDHYAPEFFDHERLALARILPSDVGNLRFGPEVGVGTIKDDAPVLDLWLDAVRRIASDVEKLAFTTRPSSRVLLADARQATSLIAKDSVHAVFTSPPYPNEKDYTRTTRLESVLLGFFRSMDDLRSFKKSLVRSNTRGVYKEDTDDHWVRDHKEIQRIAKAIEDRRIELGKTSGFERQYARVTQLYFGGMARHLDALKRILQPGARLGYVVGDQASYLQVMIRTGELLADLAERRGYKVDRIDLFRTRPSTVTKEQLREEVVVLTWPGDS